MTNRIIVRLVDGKVADVVADKPALVMVVFDRADAADDEHIMAVSQKTSHFVDPAHMDRFWGDAKSVN